MTTVLIITALISLVVGGCLGSVIMALMVMASKERYVPFK